MGPAGLPLSSLAAQTVGRSTPLPAVAPSRQAKRQCAQLHSAWQGAQRVPDPCSATGPAFTSSQEARVRHSLASEATTRSRRAGGPS